MLHEAFPPPALQCDIELLAARSELLDAFSDLEASICAFLKDAKLITKAQHLGARVEAFKTIDGISRIAKTNYPKRDKLAAEIVALLPVRADIVHSRMRICMLDGTPAAKFVNSTNQQEDFPPCRILTSYELRTMCSKVLHIVAELGQLGRIANPASLPRPPSPGATDDP